jgi:hypothetical protein
MLKLVFHKITAELEQWLLSIATQYFLYTNVETGSNTSTVTLLVVGGDEKGSLESETVKYGHESTGLGPANDCAGEVQ